MSKKTLALIVGLLILTVILLIVALSSSETKPSQGPQTPQKNQQQTSVTPSEKPQGNTLLRLSPNPVTVTTDGSPSATTVNVEIDTGTDQVTGVQLEIAYDPKVLTNLKVTPGTFFANPSVLPTQNTVPGRYMFVVTPGKFGETRTGKGTVAVISFTPVPSSGVQQTTLDLLGKTKVTQPPAQGIQSVLKKAEGTTVILSTTTQTTSSPSAQ